MKNYIDIKKPLLFVLLLTLFLFVFSSSIQLLAMEQDISIEKEKVRLNQIKQREKVIKSELEQLEKKESNYQASLEKIRHLLVTAEQELKETQSNYQKISRQITQLEEECKIEQNKLDLQLIIFQNRLKKFYKYNNITYLAVLIESKDFSQFINRYHYLETILENDAMLVKQIKELVTKLNKSKASLENKKDIIALLEKEIKNEKKNIELSLAAKKKFIIKVEEEKKKKLDRLEELKKASTEIETIIEKAYQKRKEQKKVQSETKTERKEEVALTPRKGIFQLPVQGSIISKFGKQKQKDLNAYTFNSGIDINSSLGEVVRSASFGTVIYTGQVKGYGQVIIIDHGGNVTTLYAHLSKVLVNINDQVKKGQMIGQVGSSGNTASPRLHFEVRVEGKPVDPFEWI